MESPESTDTGITKTNFLNIVAYVVNVVVTYGIGVAGFFGLPTNDEISATYPTLVTPVGWAFSIWAAIFILQLIWSIVQLVPRFRQSGAVTAVGNLYVLVVAAQVGWTFAFSTEVIWLSLIFMVAIWFALLTIVFRLSKMETKIGQYTLWLLPFTLHCGWITAATAVNANVLLVDLVIAKDILFYAAVGSVVALGVFGFCIICAGIDLVIPCVLSWALTGVFVELQNAPGLIVAQFSNSEIKQVRFIGAGVAVSLVLSVLVQLVRNAAAGKRKSDDQGQGDEESPYVRQS